MYMNLVLDTSSAAVTSASFMSLAPEEDATFAFDTFQFVSDDLSSTTEYTYDDANEMLTMAADGLATKTVFTYDDWGRRITKALGSHKAVYGYQFGDKLKSVATDIPDESPDGSTVAVGMNYDGLGKLRYFDDGLGGPSWLRWDRGFNLMGVYAPGEGTWDVSDEFIRFVHDPASPNGALAMDIPGENPLTIYYTHDHLGSVRGLYLDADTSVGTYEYTPYGEMYEATGNDYLYGFTGHLWLPNFGMNYAPYRFYDPAAARWLTRDPLGMVDGPNVYEYVGGNPLQRKDPSGLFPQECYSAPPAKANSGICDRY